MPPAIAGRIMIAADFAPIASNMYQCMTIACLCSFFGGIGGDSCTIQGRPLRKAFRKEYRQLSDEERNRVHAAFRALKNSGEFDHLATVHAQFSTSGGAHSGPAFLPWHREFIKRYVFFFSSV
ncbi:hypothetical protein OESDEN_21738 [Oesophagostomum dentatum]|uniref:Tyrosinase copper-binding domain-containing protein n=1 Tax=Oesophagostomum dentatum TaxID=61180 RepID=A0A0B1S158_OESDE|nr:hypothetical protein OESDEN_21738 [Oesophagostomum dentatum]